MSDHAPDPYDRRSLTFGALWRTVVIVLLAWVVGGRLDGAGLKVLIAVPLIVAAWAYGILILDRWVTMSVGPHRRDARTTSLAFNGSQMWKWILAALLGAIILAIEFARLVNSVVVMTRAEAIAGDRPYCIQYASQTDPFAYEPARTLFDLSAFRMGTRIASGGSSKFYWQNHGILIIDDGTLRFFNWSYRQENFLDDALGAKYYPSQPNLAPQVFCTPRTHYARRLPIWSHSPGTLDISIAGRQFSIAESYKPRMNGAALVIDAVGPYFTAYYYTEGTFAQFYYDISISDANSESLSSAVERIISKSSAAEKVEPEFNMNKIQLYADDSIRRRSVGSLYASYDDAGRLTRLISCGSKDYIGLPDPLNCRYTFLTDGLAFSLRIDDASQWAAIEQKLHDVISSFKSGRPDETRQR
jgi:hypothetical protein